VVLHADAGIDGLPFNVMERVQGSPMPAGMATGEAAVHEASVQLGRVHAQLHDLPVKPVIAALENSGFGADEFSAARQFAELSRYFEDGKLEWLRPGMDWLVKNRPVDESLAVCHGDFHPANIMVESGKVTGVIDWPGAALASPEHDVGTTVVLIKVAAVAVYPEARPMLEYVVATYLDSYRSLASLDMTKVNYHTARRCFRAYTRATASLVLGIRPELLPRAGYPWSNPDVMRAAQAEFLRITGLKLPMPSEVGQ
jgi:aminoglycoside phosphotransferase (APT) family kinase protein